MRASLRRSAFAKPATPRPPIALARLDGLAHRRVGRNAIEEQDLVGRRRAARSGRPGSRLPVPVLASASSARSSRDAPAQDAVDRAPWRAPRSSGESARARSSAAASARPAYAPSRSTRASTSRASARADRPPGFAGPFVDPASTPSSALSRRHEPSRVPGGSRSRAQRGRHPTLAGKLNLGERDQLSVGRRRKQAARRPSRRESRQGLLPRA